MKIKKLIALGLCAAMVSGMTVAPVFAADQLYPGNLRYSA